MNKEILRKNIEQVIMQPCNANYPKRIKENGLSEDGTHIMVKVTTDDSSWQCNLVDRDGNPIDYVERILERLPEGTEDGGRFLALDTHPHRHHGGGRRPGPGPALPGQNALIVRDLPATSIGNSATICPTTR